MKWEEVSKTEKREELNWTSLMFLELPKLEKPEGCFFKLNLASTNCSLYSPVRAARESREEEKKMHKPCLRKNVTCVYGISYNLSSPFQN